MGKANTPQSELRAAHIGWWGEHGQKTGTDAQVMAWWQSLGPHSPNGGRQRYRGDAWAIAAYAPCGTLAEKWAWWWGRSSHRRESMREEFIDPSDPISSIGKAVSDAGKAIASTAADVASFLDIPLVRKGITALANAFGVPVTEDGIKQYAAGVRKSGASANLGLSYTAVKTNIDQTAAEYEATLRKINAKAVDTIKTQVAGYRAKYAREFPDDCVMKKIVTDAMKAAGVATADATKTAKTKIAASVDAGKKLDAAHKDAEAKAAQAAKTKRDKDVAAAKAAAKKAADAKAALTKRNVEHALYSRAYGASGVWMFDIAQRFKH